MGTQRDALLLRLPQNSGGGPSKTDYSTLSPYFLMKQVWSNFAF